MIYMLAATSVRSALKGNVKKAMIAYDELKKGVPPSQSFGAVRAQLERVWERSP